mmetsp:Transcript_11241/g.13739  ORF Transcript_11241/g.13739 Transcript_11241/m.13739 type:complete len:1052 (-) Transcript_11241:209-3364(-)
MSLKFLRPLGAVADVKELEYVTALHQTASSTDDSFVDGSIDAKDIKFYLMSRHGIDVTEEHIREVVLSDLAGGNSEDDCFDLLELVAILIIPSLVSLKKIDHVSRRKSSEDFLTSFGYKNHLEDMANLETTKPPPTLIDDVLKIILINVTGSSVPPPITKELLTSIFATYDETDLLLNDDLIEEMIQVASGGKPNALLDREAFERALTEDVMKYDLNREHRLSTYFEDAFGSVTKPSFFNSNGTEGESAEDGKNHVQTGPQPVMVNTFPNTDFMAETFRSRSRAIVLLCSLPLAYFNFIYSAETDDVSVCGSEFEDASFGCKISSTIVKWIFVMLTLTIVGTVYASTLSLGNHNGATVAEIFLGILFASLFTIIGNTVEFNFFFFSNIRPKTMSNTLTTIAHMVCGGFLIFDNILCLTEKYCSDDLLNNNKFLGYIMKGSQVSMESQMKQAATFKVNKMIKNAYKLHKPREDDNAASLALKESILHASKRNIGEESTHSSALLNYTNDQTKTELAGGFLWAWKECFSGDLLDREGIWIHTRIVAANVVQIVTLVMLIFVIIFLFPPLVKELYPPESEEESKVYESCYSTFNVSKCEFPSVPFSADGTPTKIGIGACLGVEFVGYSEPGCDNVLQPVPESIENQKEVLCGILADAIESSVSSQGPTSTYSSAVLGPETFEIPKMDYKNLCPDLYTSNIYASVAGSDEESYCAAAVSVCAIEKEVQGDWANVTFANCILGLDITDMTPFVFSGEKCKDYDELDGLLVYDDFFPERWMIDFSYWSGIVTVIISMTGLVAILIPSTVASTLKFRSGHFQTLRNPDFNKYRTQLEDLSFLIGFMFWGMLFSSALLFALSAGTAFLIVWQVTRNLVINFISMIIGILVTLVFKICLIKYLGKYNYAGFYRKQPYIGNLVTLALECWNLALTIGYVLARIAKISVCAIFYFGRMDTPVLAEGGLGDKLDKFPHVYRKEILSAEAHRHPYIERIGFMYLMKLRHGGDFGKLSGSIWRLLFVFALMPWMRKYRLSSSEKDLMEEALLEKLALKQVQRDID